MIAIQVVGTPPSDVIRCFSTSSMTAAGSKRRRRCIWPPSSVRFSMAEVSPMMWNSGA